MQPADIVFAVVDVYVLAAKPSAYKTINKTPQNHCQANIHAPTSSKDIKPHNYLALT